MKKTIIVTSISLILLFITSDILAQNGRGNRRAGDGQGRSNSYWMDNSEGQQRQYRANRLERIAERLDLTEDQQLKISDARTKQMKEMLSIRNVLNEKQARLTTLKTADNVDMKAINKIIDEIADLNGDRMKKREQHHQDLRKILTDDQRVKFDQTMSQGRRFDKRNAVRKGNGNRASNRCLYNDGDQRKYRNR